MGQDEASNESAPAARGAIQFICVAEDGTFSLLPEGVEFFRSLRGPVAIVAVAGRMRSGKSYLMNSLSRGRAAFQVSPLVDACTKGIWVSPPVQREGAPPVVFMDTEGLFSADRDTTVDSRLFALTLLLASYFIYNGGNVIDRNALERMSVVVHLTNYVHVRARGEGEGESGSEFREHFPHFMWVARDFSLGMQHEGQTPAQYLEAQLAANADEAQDARGRPSAGAVGRALMTFFPNRDCVLLPTPLADEGDMAELPTLPADRLRPDFVRGLDELRETVMRNATAKSIRGRPLAGGMLLELAEMYIQALNSNNAPVLSTSWERVASRECRDIEAAALACYERELVQRLRDGVGAAAAAAGAGAEASTPDGRGPAVHDASTSAAALLQRASVDTSVLVDAHFAAESAAVEQFQHALQRDLPGPVVDRHRASLRAAMQAQLNEALKANERASKQACEAAALELRARLTTARPAAASASMAAAAAFMLQLRAAGDSYKARARGPHVWRALGEEVLGQGAALMEPWLAPVDREWETACNAAAAAATAMQQRVSELEGKLEAERDERARTDRANAEAQRSAAREHEQAQRSAAREHEQALRQQVELREQAQKLAAASATELELLRARHETTTSELAAAREELAAMRTELAATQALQLQQAREYAGKAEAALHEIQQELQRTREAVVAPLQQQVRELSDAAGAQQLLQHERERVALLRTHCSTLEKLLNAKEAELEAARREYSSCQLREGEQKAVAVRLRSELDDLRDERATLEALVAKLKLPPDVRLEGAQRRLFNLMQRPGPGK